MSSCATNYANQQFYYDTITEAIKTNINSEYCVTLYESNNIIILQRCNSSNSQKWYSNSSEIKNRASPTKCMTMDQSTRNLSMGSCSNRNEWNQQFIGKDADCKCTVAESECVDPPPVISDGKHICKCKDGFINSNGQDGNAFLQSVDDTCVRRTISRTIYDGFSWDRGNTLDEDSNKIEKFKLLRRDDENNIEIDLTNIQRVPQILNNTIQFKGLQAGYAYTASYNGATTDEIGAITSCSCKYDTPDVTGRPTNFTTSQKKRYNSVSFH
mmetsp:Transcript_42569/g.49760  ORF Transcript_42569/g.49760 Transcript_42569/m.49760 type:complete len:270 (-) Transcript_42569:1283-2092(-)